MRILKRILNYFIWTLIAFLFAIGYTLIILSGKPEFEGNIQIFIDAFYIYGFIAIGSIIGSFIALTFILIDVFYLYKKLEHKAKAWRFRLLLILVITFVTGLIHYILEKGIDVI